MGCKTFQLDSGRIFTERQKRVLFIKPLSIENRSSVLVCTSEAIDLEISFNEGKKNLLQSVTKLTQEARS